MKHHIYQETDNYQTAVLIKSSSFDKNRIYSTYVHKLELVTTCVVFSLLYEGSKLNNKTIENYLKDLLPALNSLNTKYLYVADSGYFKYLTKVPKVDNNFGYVLPCKIKGYEHMWCVLGINYQQLIYNPTLQEKIDTGLDILVSFIQGTYEPIGTEIIHSASYPESYTKVSEALNNLHQYSAITCDIEAFSLRFNEAGIGSISFAWDQHNGIAFEVDNLETKKPRQSIRYLIRKFFESYKGTVIYHNASYDVKVLIYNLWMAHPLDTEGLLKGLHLMCRNIHDTKIIAYLATNSTSGNKLSLKELSQSFAGNYAVEVKDITKVKKENLLKYNLTDCLSTWFVFNKFYPVMVKDLQESIYQEIMLPSLKTLIQTELTGMPMHDAKIAEAKHKLTTQKDSCLVIIANSDSVKLCEGITQQAALEAANAKLKTKQHTIDKFKDLRFNPNSGPQVQTLLYEVLGLPVLDKTETGQPATGGDTIKKLFNHCKPSDKKLLQALIDYSEAEKILSTFIPAFEEGFIKSDGIRYLHGSFNLGGTVSGRLSSSDPNLQNIPSNSGFGKTIKQCFYGNDEWIFAGADFNSLEDYISALTTKDKNKLAVYVRGFDGHCLRAAYYFRDELNHVDLDCPISVNKLKKTHPEHRQESKGPTFALTYQGTWHTLVKNLGFEPEKAKAIELNYHTLYAESDAYVQTKLKQASIDGYVTVAFGLRVRTPMLKQIIWDTTSIPYEASAEGRTAGNALGQSYGLLTNRATNAFMELVWASKYRYDIRPVAQIHDATYFLIRNRPDVIEWANRHLIKEMQWQELPEIQHPTVKLGAALDLFIDGWHKPITLPNNASVDEIINLLKETK